MRRRQSGLGGEGGVLEDEGGRDFGIGGLIWMSGGEEVAVEYQI